MSDDTSPKEPQSFSPADRIEQLNAVDKDLNKLVWSAASAIEVLTSAKLASSSPAIDGSVGSRKALFSQACMVYFKLLSSVDVQLRRQVHALEEYFYTHELGAPAVDPMAGAKIEGGADNKFSTSGSLDIGQLKVRKDAAWKELEAERWAATEGFVVEDIPQTTQDEKPANELQDM
ncbi:uncharacterized protein N7515_007320 [Penicillium bovifimosum]|uniref:Mediator of RNA polymerase II transcription subunit 11 n=1 Tax=Penicillium bovifimosum TaxID=126998 RepID=A0A9W9GWK6_9EURO|nr:uncharacterized protein N7515_007320 [Penicillium bovifimosum]KAJ5131281.1 hypothetical protein N7515_007320 [Penicillium bovifimosum]